MAMRPAGFIQHRRHDRGFTIIETVIALLIAGAAGLAFVSSAIYSQRQAQINRDHMYGMMLVNTVAAQVMAADWDRLGDPAAAAGTLENALLNGFTRQGDRFVNNVSPNFTMAITYTGWGAVDSSQPTGLTSAATPGRRAWATNEWAGQYVQIYEGLGRNSMMRIRSNTANTLTVSADLTVAGRTGALTPWPITLDNTSRYAINNGKTVQIAVSWNTSNTRINVEGADYRRIERTVFVPRPVVTNN
jgi:Tfp pilus assembly protein PilV